MTTRRTEKFLFGTLSIALLVLGWNLVKNEPVVNTQVASAESQDAQSGGGSSDEESGKSESTDSGESANSEDEASEPSTASGPSEKSAPSVRPARTPQTLKATSEASTSQEGVSVASVNDETAQLSEESIKSLKSEDSSITTVATDGSRSIVKRNGKLFFLIPVEIESEVTTNETGTVIAEKKNLLNWLKALLSF